MLSAKVKALSVMCGGLDRSSRQMSSRAQWPMSPGECLTLAKALKEPKVTAPQARAGRAATKGRSCGGV